MSSSLSSSALKACGTGISVIDFALDFFFDLFFGAAKHNSIAVTDCGCTAISNVVVLPSCCNSTLSDCKREASIIALTSSGVG